MKCLETDKNIRLLLDHELEQQKKEELETHIAICSMCFEEKQNQIVVRDLLKQLPEMLPQSAFDSRMMRALQHESGGIETPKEGVFAAFFGLRKTAVAFGTLALLVTAAIGFGIGRFSVSSPPQLNIVDLKTKPEIQLPDQSFTPPEEQTTEKNTLDNTEIRNVTKYVEVPVIKEKLIVRKIYVSKNSSQKANPFEVTTEKPDAKNEKENTAAQFNLKDMQPLETLSYQIIRKGEEK